VLIGAILVLALMALVVAGGLLARRLDDERWRLLNTQQMGQVLIVFVDERDACPSVLTNLSDRLSGRRKTGKFYPTERIIGRKSQDLSGPLDEPIRNPKGVASGTEGKRPTLT